MGEGSGDGWSIGTNDIYRPGKSKVCSNPKGGPWPLDINNIRGVDRKVEMETFFPFFFFSPPDRKTAREKCGRCSMIFLRP